MWGYADSINRIRRSTEKVVKVVSTRGNQKAKSGSMGRVFPSKNLREADEFGDGGLALQNYLDNGDNPPPIPPLRIASPPPINY